MLGATNYASC